MPAWTPTLASEPSSLGPLALILLSFMRYGRYRLIAEQGMIYFWLLSLEGN